MLFQEVYNIAFSRALLWVDEETKKEISKQILNPKKQIIFVSNYENFRKNLIKNTYTAIALPVASSHLKELKILLKDFSKQKFKIILNRARLSEEVIDAFTEADRVYDHFSIENVIKEIDRKVQNC